MKKLILVLALFGLTAFPAKALDNCLTNIVIYSNDGILWSNGVVVTGITNFIPGISCNDTTAFEVGVSSVFCCPSTQPNQITMCWQCDVYPGTCCNGQSGIKTFTMPANVDYVVLRIFMAPGTECCVYDWCIIEMHACTPVGNPCAE